MSLYVRGWYILEDMAESLLATETGCEVDLVAPIADVYKLLADVVEEHDLKYVEITEYMSAHRVDECECNPGEDDRKTTTEGVVDAASGDIEERSRKVAGLRLQQEVEDYIRNRGE